MLDYMHHYVAGKKNILVLTATRKFLCWTSGEYSIPHPGLTGIVSTVSLAGSWQPQSVKKHLLESIEGSNTWGDLLCSPEEDNFWSRETKTDTRYVHWSSIQQTAGNLELNNKHWNCKKQETSVKLSHQLSSNSKSQHSYLVVSQTHLAPLLSQLDWWVLHCMSLLLLRWQWWWGWSWRRWSQQVHQSRGY